MIRKRLIRVFAISCLFVLMLLVSNQEEYGSDINCNILQDSFTYKIARNLSVDLQLDNTHGLRVSDRIQKWNIDSAINIISKECNKEFVSYYPIDEAFLCWYARKYGQDNLYDIAGFVKQGSTECEKWYEISGKSIHVLWYDFCRENSAYTYMLDNITCYGNIAGTVNDKDIVIDFVGDINFDSKWHTMKSAKKNKNGISDSFSKEIKEELCSADVTVVNNEFAYAGKAKAQKDKDYVFSAKKDSVKYLDMLGTDIVSIANNHVYDYGKAGFINTLDTLSDAGIEVVGGGRNIDEASATKYFIVNGRKIGIISATEIEKFSHFTKAATKKDAGVFKMLDSSLLIKKIKAAKRSCDYLIAYVHWGNEGTEFFEDDQTMYAEQMADAGVDAIIGAHPHRLQGCSFIKDVPVAYSIGNFWFSTGSLYTSIAQIRIDKKGKLTMRMLPCIQRKLKTSIITDSKKKDKFYRYLADVSRKVGIDKNGTLYNLDFNQNDTNKADSKGTKRKKSTEHIKSDMEYKSEKGYSKHNSEYDIDGNRIDRVGNLE